MSFGLSFFDMFFNLFGVLRKNRVEEEQERRRGEERRGRRGGEEEGRRWNSATRAVGEGESGRTENADSRQHENEKLANGKRGEQEHGRSRERENRPRFRSAVHCTLG